MDIVQQSSKDTEKTDLLIMMTSGTRASLVAQLVKNPPAVWETWVRSLGWEDPNWRREWLPLQYPGLENSMDCIVHGVTNSRTRLSD